jgi:hypothetical protein
MQVSLYNNKTRFLFVLSNMLLNQIKGLESLVSIVIIRINIISFLYLFHYHNQVVQANSLIIMNTFYFQSMFLIIVSKNRSNSYKLLNKLIE